LLPRRPGWTDNILIFFSGFAKVRAKGLDVYWASWGAWWINPEFGRCSLFPSWSVSGLHSSPSYYYNRTRTFPLSHPTVTHFVPFKPSTASCMPNISFVILVSTNDVLLT
jgi:hypothetical protein